MRRRLVAGALAYLPVFGFAAYPILFLVGANAGVDPIEEAAVARCLAVALGAAALLVLAASRLPWQPDGRIAWLSVMLLCWALYRPIMEFVSLGGKLFTPDTPFPAAAFVVTVAAVAAAVVRPWQWRPRSPLVLCAAIAVLLVASATGAVTGTMASSNKDWQPGVEAHKERVLVNQSSPAPARDIYYFVFDGFGRQDVLRSQYELDLTDFVAGLGAKGLHVAESAHSNYAQTYLSIAATLNLTYLDELASAMGAKSHDRRPLKRMIDENVLMKAAKHAGYRVYSIGSDYSATQTVETADVCICERYGFDELESTVLGLTPFGSLSTGRWTYGAHRAKILSELDAVDRLRMLPERKFVFVHLLAPHPPFVLAADGQALRARRSFDLSDGDAFRGTKDEYIDGYRAQARYLSGRFLNLVDRLTEQPGPAPVIVMHGDHGPGSRLHWASASRSDLKERMGIFVAYAFPGEPAVLDRSVTPINVARFLARRYLGVNTPPVPDASYFSTWDEPYRFIPVAATETAVQ